MLVPVILTIVAPIHCMPDGTFLSRLSELNKKGGLEKPPTSTIQFCSVLIQVFPGQVEVNFFKCLVCDPRFHFIKRFGRRHDHFFSRFPVER